jgi:hypothetical protein
MQMHEVLAELAERNPAEIIGEIIGGRATMWE